MNLETPNFNSIFFSTEYRKAMKPFLSNLAQFCKVQRNQTATSVVQIRISKNSNQINSTGGAYY